VHRSRKYEWRAQWLSAREVERCLDQLGWLSLVARAKSFAPPAYIADISLDAVGHWFTCYLRAVLRSGSIPNARCDSNYLGAVHQLVLENLLLNQATYLDGEAAFNADADRLLERSAYALVGTAAGLTALYLLLVIVLPLFASNETVRSLIEYEHAPPLNVIIPMTVAAVGVLFPTLATALSAIRHHGEYAQLAARFQGTAKSLRRVESELQYRRHDRRLGHDHLSSLALSKHISRATDILLQEVQGWNALLRKKEIEPT
jgi:hypothetical protein